MIKRGINEWGPLKQRMYFDGGIQKQLIFC